MGDADTHVSQLRHDLQGVRDRLIASTAREEQLVAELEEQKRAHELSRSAVEAVSAERDLAREKARCANASSVELSRRVDELLETNRLQQAETGRLLQQAYVRVMTWPLWLVTQKLPFTTPAKTMRLRPVSSGKARCMSPMTWLVLVICAYMV